MTATAKVKLWAKAKRLGVSGYRTMKTPDLESAIKKAEGKTGTTGRKTAAKSSANGRKSTKTAGRKTAGRKTAGRKTASVKSSPAKSARTGTKAKRTTTRASKVTNSDAGRAVIDDSQIDWDAEWGGGQRGNRQTIMARLRKAKGDVDKVFKALAPKAQSMYPKTTDGKRRGKAAAETLLRWHISRIKFDFVKATDQHESAKSNAWVRGKASVKPAAKRTPARKSAAKPKTARKSTRKPASRQKTAQRRTTRKTVGRKTAASRKR